MKDSNSVKRVFIKIHGRVQGVFFRRETSVKARELELTGMVKNMPDGTVEIIAEGEENNLKQLLTWCESGPDLAHVDKVDAQWHEPSGGLSGFVMDK